MKTLAARGSRAWLRPEGGPAGVHLLPGCCTPAGGPSTHRHNAVGQILPSHVPRRLHQTLLPLAVGGGPREGGTSAVFSRGASTCGFNCTPPIPNMAEPLPYIRTPVMFRLHGMPVPGSCHLPVGPLVILAVF